MNDGVFLFPAVLGATNYKRSTSGVTNTELYLQYQQYNAKVVYLPGNGLHNLKIALLFFNSNINRGNELVFCINKF